MIEVGDKVAWTTNGGSGKHQSPHQSQGVVIRVRGDGYLSLKIDQSQRRTKGFADHGRGVRMHVSRVVLVEKGEQ